MSSKKGRSGDWSESRSMSRRVEADRIILLAHGSRADSWKEPFEKLLNRLRKDGEHGHVRLAYMEFSEPTLEQQLDEAREEGMYRVTVLPLLIAAGKHLSRDIPLMIERYSSLHSDMDIELLPPLGADEDFLDLLVEYLHGRV